MTGNSTYSIKAISDYRVKHFTTLSRLSSHPNSDPSGGAHISSQELKAGISPSLSIDLGDVYTLENVVIASRPNDHEYRNKTLIVEISYDEKDWKMLHGGLLYWQGILTIPTNGAATGRYLRVRLTEEIPLLLKKIEVNARIFQENQLPIFAAKRLDGLGERLNGLLNAIWLSEIFGYDFRFYWSGSLANNPMHAIAPVECMFSGAFIENHHDILLKTHKGWEISAKKLTREFINWKLSEAGIVEAPRDHLEKYLENIPEISDKSGLKRAFQRIDFSKNVDDAINVANETKLSESAVALHLRSGDVFYGIYRKHPNYSYKGITTPLAKLIIKTFVDKGHEVFLFGQDTEQLNYLAQTCGAIDTTVLNSDPIAEMKPHEKAMYDLVFLSRFQKIVAGTSGFARQASWIGGGDVITPTNIFTADEQHQASMKDLEKNAHLYHPQQAAYSYWYAYHHGRHDRDIDINIEVLRQALAFDPENELYYFVLSALLVRKGDIDQSAHVLETLFAERKASKRLRDIFNVFTLKKSKNDYKLEEYLPDFTHAVDKGSFFHAVLMFFLARSKEEGPEMERCLAICRDVEAEAVPLQRAILNYIEPRMEIWRTQTTAG